jgi:hypothetical protein
MPIRYKAEHFDFPKHLDTPVYKELPEGFEDRTIGIGPKEAWTRFKVPLHPGAPDDLRFLTFCRHCGGWVPGSAYEHRVNTLDGSRLCGRRGVEYYCPRCAKEIYFSGMMS